MIQTIPLDQITPSKTNPRRHFDVHKMGELTASVAAHGVLQPILVRPIEGAERPYELVAGERRYRAATAAKLKEIPAVVQTLTDLQVVEIQVIENLQRDDLHPLEEAEGYHHLTKRGGYDVDRLAERVGRSSAYVYDRLKLLGLVKELRTLFLADRITVGHAVILARLSPSEQRLALESAGALFTAEATLWDPRKEDDKDEDQDDYAGMKPRSVKELQAWVDEHIKFKAEEVDARLFPETATMLEHAKEQAETIIPITFDAFVRPEARDGSRVWGPRSWKQADGKRGSKPCEQSVLGVIVVGPGRGESFRVCTEKKKCKVHWAAEQREATKRRKAGATAGPDRWEIEAHRARQQQAIREAHRRQWDKALPAITEALAQRVTAAPAGATSALAELLIAEILGGRTPKKPDVRVPRGKTAEDLVRHLGFLAALGQAHAYSAPTEFPRVAKTLGLEVRPLIEPLPSCRGCGCIEEAACLTAKGPCAWVDPPTEANKLRGLCSACAGKKTATRTQRRA